MEALEKNVCKCREKLYKDTALKTRYRSFAMAKDSTNGFRDRLKASPNFVWFCPTTFLQRLFSIKF